MTRRYLKRGTLKMPPANSNASNVIYIEIERGRRRIERAFAEHAPR